MSPDMDPNMFPVNETKTKHAGTSSPAFDAFAMR